MKRVHATRVIVVLIIGVLIWQYVEKRKDLQCYVMQQADRLESVFKAGYVTAEEIRDSVWTDIETDFYGQAWRVSLDQVFHAIFMGGNRGQQVVAHLANPPDVSSDFLCGGSIEWIIWYDPDATVYRDYSGTNIKPMHLVTTALQGIPPEELQHYQVEVNLTYYSSNSYKGSTTWSGGYREVGTMSAREWLDGRIVPKYLSNWYESWREDWQELQNNDED
ncbi:MAG: hypothetical protein OXG60_13315 [Chloroflexi bacterium]|nr:hypothetical protein [Chloroflexota bacterium]